MLKERSVAVWRMILITTTVLACVGESVRVGPGSVEIAVFIGLVTSTTSVVTKDFSVPIVSRHLFGASVVPRDLADIPIA